MKSAVMKFVAALGVAGALALTASTAWSLASHRMITADVAELDSSSGAPAGETLEADPTDDGSIIVECVAMAAVLNTHQGGSSLGSASIPQSPLGPMKCWPNGNRDVR
jgi:hypothetical protein